MYFLWKNILFRFFLINFTAKSCLPYSCKYSCRNQLDYLYEKSKQFLPLFGKATDLNKSGTVPAMGSQKQ